MGEALREGYRDKVFLMTKNHGRDGDAFREQLEESLRRLNADHVDLLQFHNIVAANDADRIFSHGAIEAALDAKQQGKIRFIGFTGHHWPHLFHLMLEKEFSWDTVQHPLNPLDAQYRSFARDILPLLNERHIGIIAMKIFSGGNLLKIDVTPREAISYALSQKISTMVLGIDSLEHLSQNLQIVRNWQPMPAEEQDELVKRVAPWASGGQLERYKTDPEY